MNLFPDEPNLELGQRLTHIRTGRPVKVAKIGQDSFTVHTLDDVWSHPKTGKPCGGCAWVMGIESLREFKKSPEKILVECATCSGQPCCKQFIVVLTPEEATRLKMDPDAWAKGMAMLAKRPDGSCWYLNGGKCSIWPERPVACREYSCVGDERVVV